jgi:3D (Asp-Asp-Asp) domain-containing protein
LSRFIMGATTLAVLALAWAPSPGGAVAAAQDEIAAGRGAVVAHTESDMLLLRGGAGLSHPVQGRLPEGTRVHVLEGPQTADGHQWFRVTAGATGGWASARYLQPSASDERALLTAARGPLPPTVQGRTLQVRVVGYNLGGAARTATGTTPRWGTVAVDPQVIPLGSRLTIEGFEGTVFVAEDTGSAVRGNWVDIWFDDLDSARRFGRQTRTVTVLAR